MSSALIPIGHNERDQFLTLLQQHDEGEGYGNVLDFFGLRWSDLTAGSSGSKVKDLQSMLRAWAPDGAGSIVTLNGVYDSNTTKAVTAFQKFAGLAVTGTCDKDTWDALKSVSGSSGGGSSGGGSSGGGTDFMSGISNLVMGIGGKPQGTSAMTVPPPPVEEGWSLPWIIAGVAVTGLVIGGVIYVATRE